MNAKTNASAVYRSTPGLQGAVNMTKNSRTSNISMFSGAGAPHTRSIGQNKKKEEADFTITHNTDKVEYPWGFPR